MRELWLAGRKEHYSGRQVSNYQQMGFSYPFFSPFTAYVQGGRIHFHSSNVEDSSHCSAIRSVNFQKDKY